MNPYRGQVEITLCKKDYILRPSFDALCELEEFLQMSAFDILEQARSGKCSGRTVAAIVWTGIRGHLRSIDNLNQSPSFQTVGQECQSEGLSNHVVDILRYLTMALSSDEDIKALEETLKKDKVEESATTSKPSASTQKKDVSTGTGLSQSS